METDRHAERVIGYILIFAVLFLTGPLALVYGADSRRDGRQL